MSNQKLQDGAFGSKPGRRVSLAVSSSWQVILVTGVVLTPLGATNCQNPEAELNRERAETIARLNSGWAAMTARPPGPAGSLDTEPWPRPLTLKDMELGFSMEAADAKTCERVRRESKACQAGGRCKQASTSELEACARHMRATGEWPKGR
jgi:hypothetical protein